MPTPTKGPRLGGSPAHQKAILSNLATALFEHGAITTTEAKARRLRPYAERLITKAKRGDLHNRRQVLSMIRNKTVVHVLFTEIGPRYADRPGGYTRITKIGPRKGDNAPMAVIELVEEQFTPRTRSTKKTAPAAAASPAPAAAASAATEADQPTVEEPGSESELDVQGGTAEQEAVADQASRAEEASDSTGEGGDESGADDELGQGTPEQEAVAEQQPRGEEPGAAG